MNNNPRFDPSPKSKSPDDLRSEIDSTRRRMDDTLDALSSRLKGRHLVDEVLGFFRSSNGNGRNRASELGSKVADSASTAAHAVVESVKAHPLPTLLIGAGIAWIIFEKRRQSTDVSYDPDYDTTRELPTGWEDDVTYEYSAGEVSLGESSYGPAGTSAAAGYAGTGEPIAEGDYTIESEAEGEGRMQQMKHKLGDKASAAREQMRAQSSRLRERGTDLRERGRERARMMGERFQGGYATARERVVTTVDQHPLESGLVCLALGVVAGMLLPAPRAVQDFAGPTANRLGQRAREAGRDLVQRGKHVAQAAVEAARHEAESQGLTPEALKSKAGAVADRAKTAATETAEQEGLRNAGEGGGTGEKPGGTASSPGNPATF